MLHFKVSFSEFSLYCMVLDIVNCAADDGCHENATCTDGNGSYTCECKSGFTGDGFTCTGKRCLIFDCNS